jgi:hypothetical protein
LADSPVRVWQRGIEVNRISEFKDVLFSRDP